MAYVLGLLAADGHVTNTENNPNLIMINLKESDIELIERIRNFVEYDGKIYSQPKDNGETQAVLTIKSSEMVKDLQALGLGQHKTYSLEWPDKIPDEYITHFIRGYFDGDGCISYDKNDIRPFWDIKTTIVGTLNFITKLQEIYVNQTKGEKGHIEDFGIAKTLYMHGKYNVRTFLDWIYKDSTPSTRLSRKYNIYKGFRDCIGNEEKVPNNSTINAKIAKEIRDKHQSGMTVSSISKEMNLSEYLIHDVVQNRSWHDENYHLKRKKGDTLIFTYEGRTGTLTQWSEWTGVPKNTIDRRLREGKTFSEAITTERSKPIEKKKSEKDIKAKELAQQIRQAYKDGKREKEICAMFDIKDSKYADIIGNRTLKEENIWWR